MNRIKEKNKTTKNAKAPQDTSISAEVKMTRKKPEQKIWSLRPVWQGRAELARSLRTGELITQLLYNRGISAPESAQQFLQPSLNDLIEPQKLIGIPAAVKRIRQALRADEKIVLYGDYDVDGIMGVSILWRCLQLMGTEVDFYVPHRIDEGYGLNVEAIQQLAQQGTNLLITVDCGISAHESAQMAQELGLDLIITDHHKIEGSPVPALALVHPDLPGQDYPNPDLCGAGVAFKLAWALAQEFSGAKKVSDEFREFLLSATALTALGTIADVVPLLGENRILARFGMEGLAGSSDTAIQALIRASGLEGAKLSSSDIAFRLAPRLNAAGRMGHARLAVEMFTKCGLARATEIARYLEAQNKQRQKVEKDVSEQAIQQVKQLKMNTDKWRGLVLAGTDWHAGVIGIVASRVVDRFHRPTIVISLMEDKALGSCRSVPGFDICLALQECSRHLLTFGGHAMAAGLSIDPDHIEDFRSAFNQYALEHLDLKNITGTIDIDAQVTPADLDMATVQMIERLGPFGAGNPVPRLVARNLQLVGLPRRMGGGGKHLQFNVSASDDPHAQLRSGSVIRVVAFGKADWEKQLIDHRQFDLVFEPVINHFNGNSNVEFIAVDLKVPQD